MRPVALASVLLALAGAACAGAPRSPAEAAAPGEAGARLYRAKCSACHRAYPPEERTRAAWADVLSRMAPKAHLSPEERGALHDWLDAHARDAGPAASPR